MAASPSKYWRLAPQGEGDSANTLPSLDPIVPDAFVAEIRPKQGVVLARWDSESQLGNVQALGIVRTVGGPAGKAKIDWVAADISFRPNPTGRRWWAQEKPYFGFAKDVAERYMLDDLFAEHFPEFEGMEFGTPAPNRDRQARPSPSPTGGFVYVIRSKLGFKIGKTVNLRQRTRLFAVKLPFPNSLEHYAWFEDYTQAERAFHLQYHASDSKGSGSISTMPT